MADWYGDNPLGSNGPKRRKKRAPWNKRLFVLRKGNDVFISKKLNEIIPSLTSDEIHCKTWISLDEFMVRYGLPKSRVKTLFPDGEINTIDLEVK